MPYLTVFQLKSEALTEPFISRKHLFRQAGEKTKNRCRVSFVTFFDNSDIRIPQAVKLTFGSFTYYSASNKNFESIFAFLCLLYVPLALFYLTYI